MGVLNILVQREGRFTPLMIAELLGVSKPMVAAHIAVLETKGYVQKDYLPDDRRSFYLIPTDKARELVEKTAEKMRIYLSQIEDALGEESFTRLLCLLSDVNGVLANMKRKRIDEIA